MFPQPVKEDDCGDVSRRSSLRRCRSGPDTDRCENNTHKQTPADLPSSCDKQLAHTIPFLFQKSLPKFPADREGQAKFINMVNKPLNVSAGGNNFDLEPFTVLQLAQYTVHHSYALRGLFQSQAGGQTDIICSPVGQRLPDLWGAFWTDCGDKSWICGQFSGRHQEYHSLHSGWGGTQVFRGECAQPDRIQVQLKQTVLHPHWI